MTFPYGVKSWATKNLLRMVGYCPVVYGMPCIEDHTLSRGAPASLSNYATYTCAWARMAFHESSTSSLDAWASTTTMCDCALMPTLLQALFKGPAPNPCKDAGLAARLDHHTLATCPNNEPQFKRIAVLEDQAEVEISLQCFEGI